MSQAKCHKDQLQEPPNVLVIIPGTKPRNRIGVVKFYESGYYSCSADHADWSTEQVDAFVKNRNDRNGISDEVTESVLAASMFGWHIPAAGPAIEWFKEFRSRPI